ncbi:MAG: hypothetical protein QE487_07985 [Fluviicola sp.]|nr:hypothetical protein [Fluviicola sp.]
MKTLKLLGFVAILGATILSTPSCGKYEEGPGFSLLTKKSRLVGDWDLKETVYGSLTTADTDDDILTFEKDGTVKATDGSTTISGTWEFTSDKEKVRTTYEIFGTPVSADFTILRLKSKELWLQDDDNYIYKYEAK